MEVTTEPLFPFPLLAGYRIFQSCHFMSFKCKEGEGKHIACLACPDRALWLPCCSVSTGIGACMAAGVYEVGRPARLSSEEAVTLEAQWQDFGAHAPIKLLHRCVPATIINIITCMHSPSTLRAHAVPGTACRCCCQLCSVRPGRLGGLWDDVCSLMV